MADEKPWHFGKTRLELIEMLESRIVITCKTGTLVDAPLAALYHRSYLLLGRKPKIALALELDGGISWEESDANIILP